jgi:hypothetical protein
VPNQAPLRGLPAGKPVVPLFCSYPSAARRYRRLGFSRIVEGPSLAATLRKMSDEKAYQLIERIMEFNRKLRGLVVTRRPIVDPMPNEGRSSVH